MLNKFRNLAFVACLALGAFGGIMALKSVDLPRVAKAGFIPQITGAVEPGQVGALLNTTIQSINSSVGQVTSTATAFATATGTAEQTAASYTIPGNLLVQGSAFRQICWGVAANNANVKTAKIYFGAQSASLTVTASAATQWFLEATTILSSLTANTTLFRTVNTAVAQALTSAPGTDAVAGGTIVAKCTLTDGTSSAADLTMQGYLAEVIH